MYRCSECQSEYKNKPQYCDCGNDIFEYIEEKKQLKQSLSLEQKSEIVSWSFFVICLILSFIVWLIPISNSPALKQPVKETIQLQTTNIPNIDKIWNNTPIYEPKVEKVDNKPTMDTIRKQLDLTTPKKSQTTDIKKKITKPTTKPVEQKPKEVTKPIKQTQTTKQQEPVQQKAPESKVIKTEPKKLDGAPLYKETYNPNSPEMLKYKGELRSALFQKFPVGSIQGSGDCSVQFSIDSTGKLINRKFLKESTNKTLNDSVYYMLMSVPKFNPPPAGYNGETIQMNFKIDNGAYEISIH